MTLNGENDDYFLSFWCSMIIFFLKIGGLYKDKGKYSNFIAKIFNFFPLLNSSW